MSVHLGLVCGEIVEGIEKSNFVCKNLAGLCFESSARVAEFVQHRSYRRATLLLRQEMLI
jgi:hypothetical protein